MQSDNGSSWFVILFVGVFVAIILYAIISKIKRRGATWTGTVIDKNMSETATSPRNNSLDNERGLNISMGGNRNAINRSYSLKIKTDSGEEINWPVGEGFYESVNVGDRLTKTPGTETPTKISQ